MLFNQVPKKWSEKEIYCNLISNSDASCNLYDMLPRLGAFEISTVFRNKRGRTTDILFYSKVLSHLFPNIKSVTSKVDKYFDSIKKRLEPNNTNTSV